MMVNKNYGVILLSAGYGKRLQPITLKRPKVLVNIKDKPILDHWLQTFNNLKKPPQEILINTHYLSNQVVSFLKKKQFDFKIKITYESKLKGSFGTVIHNNKWIMKFNKVIILYADILFTNKIDILIDKYIYSSSVNDAILLSDKRDNIKNCGQLKFNKSKILKYFAEKPKKKLSKYANSGLYIFDAEYLNNLINQFKKNNNYKYADIADALLPLLVEKAYVYVIKGKVVDIGTKIGLKNARKIKFTDRMV